jgi:hypothetical protein
MRATGPKGSEVNPCVKSSRRPWDCWSLSDLGQVDCRSLATLNAKVGFLILGGLKWGIASPRQPKPRAKAGEHRFPHGTSRYCQVAVRSKRVVGDRSVEGTRPLSCRKLHRIDLKARPTVAVLGPDYIRPPRDPGASTCFHFRLELGLPPPCRAQKSESAAELRFATTAPSHASEVASDY